MPGREPELVTLIRLRQGSLPPAEGLRLRERLAMKEDLRGKWRRLAEHLDAPWPLTQPPDISEETIAAFVEGQLDVDGTGQFEARCWSEPALIHETAAACAARFAAFDDVPIPPQVASRLQTLLEQHLTLDDHRPSRLIAAGQRNGTTSSVTSGHTDDPAQTDAVADRSDERAAVHPGEYDGRLPRSGRLRLIAVSLAVTTLVGGAFILLHRGAPPEDQANLAQRELKPSPEQRGPSERQPLDPTLPETPDRIVPSPPESVVEAPSDPAGVSTPHNSATEPMAPDSVEPRTGASERPAEIAWTDISGLLLSHDRSRQQWRGIHALSHLPAAPGEPQHLMTLPKSWAAGDISGGARLILDEDTRASYELLIGDSLRAVIDVARGRTAIEQLQIGDVLVVQHGDRGWPVRIDQKDTSVVLRVSEAGLELHVLTGEVAISRTTIRDGSGVHLRPEGLEVQRAAVRTTTWRHRPQDAFPLQRELVQRLLESADVLATLDGWDDRRTQPFVRRLALAIDPVDRIPGYAAAADEADRIAAIEWLVHVPPSDERVTAAWTRLEQGPLRQTNLIVRPWFALAGQPRSATVRDLQQLVAGLNPQQPVFVRQSAIYFLRQITGRPLREYSAGQPTRAGISAVSQQVRQFQTRRRAG